MMLEDQSPIILLLEDQALVRAGMRALIQLCAPRADIREAGCYQDAIGHLSEGVIDIAFLDVDLKDDKSGIDVLTYIRTGELPSRAIMLSARADEATVMTSIRLGACGYIVKDMDSEGLFGRALDTVFQGGVFLPASILGRGGFCPTQTTPAAPNLLEDLGVKGRMLEALFYICQGYSNAVIAYKMGVAESTVANEYNSKLFKKFRVTNRAGLIVEVSRRGIVPPQPFKSLNQTVQ
jgi:two-component system nitrate/nitrite response regulator NarL